MRAVKRSVHYSQLSSGNALASVNFDSLQDIVKVFTHNSSKKQQKKFCWVVKIDGPQRSFYECFSQFDVHYNHSFRVRWNNTYRNALSQRTAFL